MTHEFAPTDAADAARLAVAVAAHTSTVERIEADSHAKAMVQGAALRDAPADLVRSWVLRHHDALRTYPAYADLPLDAVVELVRADLTMCEIPAERLRSIAPRPFRAPPPADHPAVIAAASKRARKAAARLGGRS